MIDLLPGAPFMTRSNRGSLSSYWWIDTWNLFVELNGISCSFLCRARNSSTFPIWVSIQRRRAASEASPSISLNAFATSTWPTFVVKVIKIYPSIGSFCKSIHDLIMTLDTYSYLEPSSSTKPRHRCKGDKSGIIHVNISFCSNWLNFSVEPHVRHTHSVLCQSSSLIGTNHCRWSQSFNSFEMFHQTVFQRHPLRSECETNRDRGKKT